MKRFFVVPLFGATWMDIVLSDTQSANDEGSSKLFTQHTVQLLPHAAYRDFEDYKHYSLRPGKTVVASFAVQAGITVDWEGTGRH